LFRQRHQFLWAMGDKSGSKVFSSISFSKTC
jgi:hypothetical protein